MPPAPRRDRATRRTLLRGAALTPLAALLAACSGSGSGPAPSPSPSPRRSNGATSGTGLAGPSTAATTSALQPVAERPFVEDIVVPWAIVHLPSGGALVSSRDTGRVLQLSPAGRSEVVGEVPDVVSNASDGGEGGLLGLALHPRFPGEPWLYAYRSTDSGNEVVRMRYDGGRLGAPTVVLDGIRMSLHHNGGGLAFGPDGHLFVSTGDAEDRDSAQDRSSLNGKILRVTDTGRTPGDNPFRSPVWTYGHRNVEGLAFDGTGQLWASEFGDQSEDELNEVVRGGNYGWPDVEGGDGPGGYRDPLATWPTDECSPSGIAVLHGRAWLGALRGECVYSVVLRGPRRGDVRRHFAGDHGRIRAVSAAPDGSLWVGTSNRDGRGDPRPGDDRILRVPFG